MQTGKHRLRIGPAVLPVAVRMPPICIAIIRQFANAPTHGIVGAAMSKRSHRINAFKPKPTSRIRLFRDNVEHSAKLRPVLQRRCTAHQFQSVDAFAGWRKVTGRVSVHIRVGQYAVVPHIHFPRAVGIQTPRRHVDLIARTIHVIDKYTRHTSQQLTRVFLSHIGIGLSQSNDLASPTSQQVGALFLRQRTDFAQPRAAHFNSL